MGKTVTKYINFSPNSTHQKNFINSDKYEKILIAGFGAGKSKVGAASVIQYSIINTGCASLVVSPSFPIAKKAIIPAVIEILDTSDIEYSYNIADHKIYIHELGSTIYFGSAEIPSSLKGSNCAALLFDEMAVISEDAYLQSIARIRDPKAKKLVVMGVTTPEGMGGWFYDTIVRQENEDRDIIYGTTYDNKSLPQSYIKSLESRYSEELRQQYLMGKFVEFGGKVIKPSWFKKFSLENKPDWVINYSIDTAYGKEGSDATGILAFSVLNENLYLWDYVEVNLMFPDLVKYITEYVKRNKHYRSSKVIIEPKASGLSIIQQLQYTTDLNVVPSAVPSESKFSRVVAYTGVMEAGRVFIHESSDWDRFLFECSQFTREENYADEAVDCLTMALQERDRYIVDYSDLIL